MLHEAAGAAGHIPQSDDRIQQPTTTLENLLTV
jgi:hypothetical protein